MKSSLTVDHYFKDRRMSTPPTQLPFAEVKYFDSASSVRRHLMAAPRALIQTALEDPNAYLQSADLSSSSQLGKFTFLCRSKIKITSCDLDQ